MKLRWSSLRHTRSKKLRAHFAVNSSSLFLSFYHGVCHQRKRRLKVHCDLANLLVEEVIIAPIGWLNCLVFVQFQQTLLAVLLWQCRFVCHTMNYQHQNLIKKNPKDNRHYRGSQQSSRRKWDDYTSKQIERFEQTSNVNMYGTGWTTESHINTTLNVQGK